MTYRIPTKPTRRQIANHLEGLAALHKGVTPNFTEAKLRAARVAKPRAEREAGASDAIKEWRRGRGDVRLWRQNVGEFKLSDGRYFRAGLCRGSSDFVGLHSVIVTPGMVGKRVAVFLALETKAPGKDAESHQEAWLNEVKDAGGIAGVARNAQEAEDMLARWFAKTAGDAR